MIAAILNAKWVLRVPSRPSCVVCRVLKEHRLQRAFCRAPVLTCGTAAAKSEAVTAARAQGIMTWIFSHP